MTDMRESAVSEAADPPGLRAVAKAGGGRESAVSEAADPPRLCAAVKAGGGRESAAQRLTSFSGLCGGRLQHSRTRAFSHSRTSSVHLKTKPSWSSAFPGGSPQFLPEKIAHSRTFALAHFFFVFYAFFCGQLLRVAGRARALD